MRSVDFFVIRICNSHYERPVHSTSSEPSRVSHELMRKPPIDTVFNAVEPIRNKENKNWCQRRMYTMDQSCPNFQTNSITNDSEILH